MRNVGNTGSERVPCQRVKKKKYAERVIFDSLGKKTRMKRILRRRPITTDNDDDKDDDDDGGEFTRACGASPLNTGLLL